MIELFVPGPPVGKHRPRATRTGRIYTPAENRVYENQIQLAWQRAGAETFDNTPALALTVTAIYNRPASHLRKKLGGLSAQGRRCPAPTTPTDLDNVVKIVSDALNGFAYRDDRQINAIIAFRRWSKGADDPEGVKITVYPTDREQTSHE